MAGGSVSRISRTVVLAVMVLAASMQPVTPLAAQTPPDQCTDGSESSVVTGSWPPKQQSTPLVLPSTLGGGFVDLELIASAPGSAIPQIRVGADGTIFSLAAIPPRTIVAVESGFTGFVDINLNGGQPLKDPVPWELRINFTSVLDCFEPNNSIGAAVDIQLDNVVEAFLFAGYRSLNPTGPSDSDYSDWYSFVLDQPTDVEILAFDLFGDGIKVVELYDTASPTFPIAQAQLIGPNANDALISQALLAGTYAVQVSTAGGLPIKLEAGNTGNPTPRHWVEPYHLLISTVGNNPPMIASPGIQNFYELDAISIPVSASDPDGDNIEYAASGLPDGVSIDPFTGLISGVLAVGSQGTYEVTVTVTETDTAELLSASTVFSLGVKGNLLPLVTNPGSQESTEGDSVALQIEARDIDQNNLSYSAEGLPPGLTIDPLTGLISGVVEDGTASIYDVTVAVTDDGVPNKTASVLFTWSVKKLESLCTIEGDEAANVLIGTPGDDVICGFGGNDVIIGGAGNDIVIAGPGRDLVIAGPGDDLVSGGPGRDFILGGRGNDTLNGEEGFDILLGGPGFDKLNGGPSSDLCFVGPGGGETIDCGFGFF